jgi:glycosyltransferase involved in cell wall biosynthesis
MRVLMVTSSYPKYPGDVTAPFIESIATGVAARGHAVDVVLPWHPELRRTADEPVAFHSYRYAPIDAWARWGYAQSLESDLRIRPGVYLLAPLVAVALRHLVAERLRDTRYDVVHAHWLVPNAVLIDDLPRLHGAGLVVSLHGSDVFVAERKRWLRRSVRRCLDRAGAVTACSGDLHRRVLGLGAEPSRVRTLPYGVDLERFSPAAARAGMRERLGTPPGRLLVLAVGRLVEKKGFRYLIEAAARCPAIHLAIAGRGDLEPELRRLAGASGGSVHFAGALERRDVESALASADVVAVPSVRDAAGNVDGLPNVLLEALASGAAVVASRVAGIPDVVTDGENGLLVPAGEAAPLAAALERLAADPPLRARLGRNARAEASRRLTWSAAARSFEESYAQAAALEADPGKR